MNLNDLNSLSPVQPKVRRPDSHQDCMMCGEHSTVGLSFYAVEDGVEASFEARETWQGYEQVLHGGMICSLLDAAMAHCLFLQGIEAMTADLQVRFLKPVPCGTKLILRARLLEVRRELYRLSAEMRSSRLVLARAEGRFVRKG